MNFHCTVTHEDEDAGLVQVKIEMCRFEYEQSGLVFISMDNARHELQILDMFRNCSFVAKGYYVTPYKDGGLGIALIERVSTLSNWIQKTPNLQLWYYHPDGSIITGLDFRKLCFQVCRALEVIHNANKFHGNIRKGVLIGEDNNVRVCNFTNFTGEVYSNSSILSRQKNDISKLVLLLKQHADGFGVSIPSDLKVFFDMCERCCKSNYRTLEEFKIHSKWVFNAPLYWKQAKVLFFFDVLYEIVLLNPQPLSTRRFLTKYLGWQQVLWNTRDQSFRDCLTFQLAPSMKPGEQYYHPFDILLFIRNYKKHYKRGRTVAQAFEYVTSHFQHFLEHVYNEVIRVADVCVTLSRDGVRQELSSILWNDPSVFVMDDCRI